MPLVRQIVARFLRRLPPSVLREDLMASGTLGLLDALRKSPGAGPTFEGYARIRIRGAVLDGLRAQDWLPRRARGRDADARALGDTSGMALVGLDDVGELASLSLTDSHASPYDQVADHMQRAALDGAVAQLPEREASIVKWHYFDDVSFTDIAARLSVSPPRISQLHARALFRMRGLMTDDSGAGAAA